ncbi:hypothetical protein DYB32_010547, partial [Aphanomyces invadans]
TTTAPTLSRAGEHGKGTSPPYASPTRRHRASDSNCVDDLILELNSMEGDLTDPTFDLTWANMMDRLEVMDDLLDRLWRTLSFLCSVAHAPMLMRPWSASTTKYDSRVEKRGLLHRGTEKLIELAQLLGFQTFADLSLAQKTAPSVLEVEEMINAHHDTSDPVVETKFQQLQTFADPMATTDSWSNGTWLFWYALQHSSDGAAGIARRRTFFFDPYARPGQKRHGGWINETVNRSKVLGIPEHLVRVADFKIVCNLPPPMEQEGLPFTSSLAHVTRTRWMETVVAVPLPPPTQAELDELRMQSVERAAATSSHFNQMTYDELAQFHAQRSAMAQHLEEERPLDMAAAMEKNRQEQEESRAALSRQQEELVRQLEEMKRPMAEQSRLSEAHHDMLRQASDAMLQQHYKVEELNQKVRRDSESWGLFAEETSQRSAFTTGRAAEAPRLENLMGVQQVPYKGSTKRERREFMDEYLAYSRRVE